MTSREQALKSVSDGWKIQIQTDELILKAFSESLDRLAKREPDIDSYTEQALELYEVVKKTAR
jgi:hypothetical protein